MSSNKRSIKKAISRFLQNTAHDTASLNQNKGTNNEQNSDKAATIPQKKRTEIGRPTKEMQAAKPTVPEIPRTIKIEKEIYEKIVSISDHNGITIKDIVNASLRNYISKYEKNHGPVTPRESNISAESLIR